MKKLAILAILFTFAVAFAEDKPSPVDEATQNKILKANHAHDQALAKLADIKDRWSRAQDQSRQAQEQAQKVLAQQQSALNSEAEALQPQLAKTQKDLDEEIDAAYKAAKLDKTKYSFNLETFVFSPLTSPAPPTPSPEKK